MNMSAHWTEWFDEDLAWGGPLVRERACSAPSSSRRVFEEIIFRGLLYATLRRRLRGRSRPPSARGSSRSAHGYGGGPASAVCSLSGLLWGDRPTSARAACCPNMAAHVLNNLAAALGVLLLLR